MANLTFEDIRVNGETPLNLIHLTPQTPNPPRPVPSGAPSRATLPRLIVPGDGPYIHNVTFKNVEVYGQSSEPGSLSTVLLEGLTETHDVANITFDNVTRYG